MAAYKPATLNQNPEAITWAREAKLWTKEGLAGAAGISRQLLSAIESGERNATPEVLAKLAQTLNCPISVLERPRTWRSDQQVPAEMAA